MSQTKLSDDYGYVPGSLMARIIDDEISGDDAHRLWCDTGANYCCNCGQPNETMLCSDCYRHVTKRRQEKNG